MNKCPVLIGEDEKVCGREGVNVYKSEIELTDGRLVVRNLYVCNRHKDVFEEVWNAQDDHN